METRMPFALLDQIKHTYQSILGSKLTGIYIHGSIAFGCFRWDVSDIDFLVVVRSPLELPEKEALISELLALDASAPPKGFEMSVVLEDVCTPFFYPTPFELHFSNSHKGRCLENLTEYCRTMNGTDKDLAAHFTVLRHNGLVLCGNPIPEVFTEIPRAYYLDSILWDTADAAENIFRDPVYCTLNLCRVLAYLEDEKVLSKEQGGLWGIQHLDAMHGQIIRSALDSYRTGSEFYAGTDALRSFAEQMLRYIERRVFP